MRASDLLGAPVVDSAGRPVGRVADLRCVQDGPRRGSMAAPRVRALLVSPRRAGSLLGYERRDQEAPWLVRAVVRRLHGRLRVIPWSAVRGYPEPGQPIRLAVPLGELDGAMSWAAEDETG